MEDFSDSCGFKEIAHTADLSLLVSGSTLEELFVHAARGMYYEMGITANENPEKAISLALQEQDQESLLVSFLSELLYLAEKRLIARDFHLEIDGLRLTGSLFMIPVLKMQTEIKAVTYNNLRIRHYDRKYQTQLVFDI